MFGDLSSDLLNCVRVHRGDLTISANGLGNALLPTMAFVCQVALAAKKITYKLPYTAQL
jgi:hypothetical protein